MQAQRMQGDLHMTSRELVEFLVRGVIAAFVAIIVVIALSLTLEHMGASSFYNNVIVIPAEILVTLVAIFAAASKWTRPPPSS
jgi:type IV secretory pathway VirB2 component (pilin)